MALEFPLQFKRQYASDLDVDKVFETEEDLNNYLSDPVRYAGQVVTCLEREGEIFILNNALSEWISFSPTALVQTNENIVATTTIGGISSGTVINSGTNFEDIFKNILSPYQTSKLVSINILTPSQWIFEVGQPVAIGPMSFTYTSDSDGIAPHDFKVIGQGFRSDAYQSSPIPSLGEVYSSDMQNTTTWTLSAINSRGDDLVSKTVSIQHLWKIYFGASSNPNLFTPASLQQPQTKLNAGFETTWITNSANSNISNYTYIIYPDQFGLIKNITLNGGSAVLGAFIQLENIMYTNSYGISNIYYVYRSNSPGAFEIGSTLKIS